MSQANAYSAQGATLKIGAVVAAKNITAATKANPIKLTSTAHGLTDGAVVVLASLGGMVEANGKVGVVRVVDANSFELPGIDSTGYTTYTTGGTATGIQAQLGNWKTWSGFDGQASVIDTTDLDSTAKESRPGLVDFGSLSLACQINDTDQGQQALRSSLAATGPASAFVLTFKNGKTRSFSGYCTSAPEQGGVDAIIEGTFAVKITGSVTRG